MVAYEFTWPRCLRWQGQYLKNISITKLPDCRNASEQYLSTDQPRPRGEKVRLNPFAQLVDIVRQRIRTEQNFDQLAVRIVDGPEGTAALFSTMHDLVGRSVVAMAVEEAEHSLQFVLVELVAAQQCVDIVTFGHEERWHMR